MTKLAAVLKERGLSLRAFSLLSGLSRETINSFARDNGAYDFRMNTLLIIAKTLRINIWELIPHERVYINGRSVLLTDKQQKEFCEEITRLAFKIVSKV